MKKLKLILGTALIVLFMSCEGDQGPPGFDGEDALQAEVFEQTVNFTFDTESNTWNSEIVSFDGALEGDVYLGFVSLGTGIFTSLPASFFDDLGEFQYTFDHDFDTVQFQIIGDNDLSTLGTDFTDGVVTRIAVIPAELFADSNFNSELDINSLMQGLDLDESDIIVQ